VTRPFDKHLDGDELDGLVFLQATRVPDSGQSSQQTLEEAQRHVDSCQGCRRKVHMHKSAQNEISRLEAWGHVPPTSDCLSQAEWLDAAAGLLPKAKTTELMNHAAQCGHCGPLLRNAAETLADETTPQEEEFVASLSSAQPWWQKNMVEKLQRGIQARGNTEVKNWWRALFPWPRPVFAIAGIAFAVAAGVLALRFLRPLSANQLLALAYTQNRTLEVRIPGAKYAPIRVDRSAVGSNLDKSPSLLKAEVLIGENLQKNPNDPQWLQAKARADLLDGNYESSIKSLQRALETEPDSAPLLADLGSAYFVRAEAANRPIDYGNAIESLGKALAKSPDDPVALFNRALACERIYLYTQAIDDWQHYLRVDPSGGWAEDARSRLAALQNKLQQHERSLAEPLLQPSEISNASTSDAAMRAQIDGRIEEYLQVAVEDWLTRAYSSGAQDVGESSEFRGAIRVVAELTAQKHGDYWLSDILAAQEAPSLIGLQALSKSVRMNELSNYGSAEQAAAIAASYFAGSGEKPLLLRARLEQLIAMNRRFEGKACFQVARVVQRELANSPYIWIHTQLILERANCANSAGNASSNRPEALVAIQLAEAHRYDYLHLRSVGFLADGDRDVTRSFATNVEGLRSYWAGITNPSRAYQFYAVLAASAESRRRWKLATVLNREAVAAIAAANRPAIEAAARSWLGSAAYQAGYRDEAGREWRRSREMFNSIPTDRAVRSALAQISVNLAKVDLDSGKLSNAAADLADAGIRFSEPGLHRISIDYFTTLGRLRERQNRRDEAEQSFKEAIARTEQELATAKSVFERVRLIGMYSACYRAAVRIRVEAGDTVGAQVIWEHYRNVAGRPQNVAMSSGADWQSTYLSRDAAVYSLVDLDDRLVAWLTTGQGTQFRELNVSGAEFKHTAERFKYECSDSSSSIQELRADGQRLHTWLLAPLEEQIGSARILIVEEDPSLPAIPFEALVDENGHYLAETHAVAYTLGSAYLQQTLPTAVALLAGNALVVAPTPDSSQFQEATPLPESDREAHTVAARFPRSTLLEGSQASLSALKRNLDGVSVFHYAGHASASPGYTGLWLAGDSKMDASQASVFTPESVVVDSLRHLDLVVLSACSTAQAPEEDSSDIAGLSQDFLLAGSELVVGNKWAADSVASELLMRTFYDSLLAGSPAAVALSKAQSQLRHEQSYEHPFFWCAPSIWL
jgi:CHAT domain-containing protein